MRIILTGSNGFLGSSLFKLLDRDHEIIHINRANFKNFRGISIDLDLANEQFVDQAISLGLIPNADVLINLASRTANSINQNDLSVLFDNVTIAKTVSRIVLHSKVEKLINISSMSVYPNVDGEYTEESMIDPSKNSDCLYGLSKFSMEVLFDFFLKNENIMITHLRVAMLDGEGLRSDRLMAVLEREMYETKSIKIFGNGERVINFISVKRASEIIMLFVLGNYKGVFNIGDECMSLESIAKRIASLKKEVNIIKFNNGNKSKFKLNFEKLKVEVMNKNINCNLCRSYDVKEILAKGLTTIWTNSTGFENSKKHKCLLYQCLSCGHVFQPLTAELEHSLSIIYSSDQHSLSTLPGVGNWGLVMGNWNIDFLDKLDYSSISSACEIGCGNDFYLQHLKDKGITDLFGIDPSFKEDFVSNGIYLKGGFVNSEMKLNKVFDLIYSMNVFEHIENLDEIFVFINNHLCDNGKLFFCVPNCHTQLSIGDPALFIHEHINYFTENVLINLLNRNNFDIVRVDSTSDTYYITAQKTLNPINNNKYTVPDFGYNQKLEFKLRTIVSNCEGKRILFHGVCNSLNNILNWIHIENNFLLADNDETKQGKIFFGKVVNKPSEALLKEIDVVYILPLAYSDIIIEQYVNLGFRGELNVV